MQVSATKTSAQVEGSQGQFKSTTAKDVDLFEGFMSLFQDNHPPSIEDDENLQSQLMLASMPIQFLEERPLYLDAELIDNEQQLSQVGNENSLVQERSSEHSQQANLGESLPQDRVNLNSIGPDQLPVSQKEGHPEGLVDAVAFERLTSDPITSELESLTAKQLSSIDTQSVNNKPVQERDAVDQAKMRKGQLSQEKMNQIHEVQGTEKMVEQNLGVTQTAMLEERRELLQVQPSFNEALSQDNPNRKTIEEEPLNRDLLIENLSGTNEVDFSKGTFPASLEEVDKTSLQASNSRADYKTWTNESEVKSAIRQQLVVLRKQDTTKLVLKLYPQHLGAMSVELKMKNGGVLANVVLDQIEAKPLIEQAFADLKLDQMPLESLNVEINNHNNQHQKESAHDGVQASQTSGDELEASTQQESKSMLVENRLLNLRI